MKTFHTDFNMLVRIVNGTGSVYVNGKKFDIQGDETIIIPRMNTLSCHIESSNGKTLIVDIITFTFNECSQALSELSPPPVSEYHTDSYFGITTPKSVASNFYMLKCIKNDQSLKLDGQILYQSFYFILQAFSQEFIDLHRLLNVEFDSEWGPIIARLIMDEPQKKWDLERVANLLFTTQSTLRRRLKLEDVVFSHLVLEVRMGLALNLLTFSNLPISVVSQRTGFSSAAYFCDAFRRKYGLTPLTFRKESREQNK
ncbi:AraC family transcriptional regulator [Vibrio kasasachensis]|uniref:helix-turn-helix transcriptional regulator n=1 Tax=Vibrio kasasachensis TaxID=2910248 RepID=UPI003D112AFA